MEIHLTYLNQPTNRQHQSVKHSHRLWVTKINYFLIVIHCLKKPIGNDNDTPRFLFILIFIDFYGWWIMDCSRSPGLQCDKLWPIISKDIVRYLKPGPGYQRPSILNKIPSYLKYKIIKKNQQWKNPELNFNFSSKLKTFFLNPPKGSGLWHSFT